MMEAATDVSGTATSSPEPTNFRVDRYAALERPTPGPRNPGCHRGAVLDGITAYQVVDVRSVHPDGDVEAIQQWRRQPPR